MGRPRTDISLRIVHSARAQFLEDGVDGASLRTIARGAKTSIGMVYYYYPTKDALFLAVIEELYVKLLGDLEAILGASTPLRQRLEAAFTRIGHASDDELNVIRLVIREALVSSPRFEQVLKRFRRGHIRLLGDALAAGAAAGEIDAAIPAVLALIATFATGGLPQLLRRAAPRRPPLSKLPTSEALARASVAVLFEGIGAKKR